MDVTTAQSLLEQEREGIRRLLGDVTTHEGIDKDGASEHGDMADSAPSFTAEEYDSAIEASIRERLARVEAALARIADGTWGKSVRSGAAISPERLEADPAAELTVEEAEADQLGS